MGRAYGETGQRARESVGVGRAPSLSERMSLSEQIPVRSARFAILGDLQPTSRLEWWRESNPDESARIVGRIAEEAPDFLVLLGDMVFRGSSVRQWKRYETLTASLRQSGIPVFPVLGNHEYWLAPHRALPRYFSVFPDLAGARWYARRYGGLELLFLDSNRFFLGKSAWDAQARWLEDRIARAEDDAAALGILVFVHHPPYTNSAVTGDGVHVQASLVPAFQKATKSLAMISGHVHSYERFARAGKTYLVAGGGGGPRARLHAGDRRRHLDDLFAGPQLRPFHYIVVHHQTSGLTIDVRGLDKRGERFEPMDAFELPFRAGSIAQESRST